MGVGDIAHELGVAEPTVGHQHRFGQGDAAPRKGGQTLIAHLLSQIEFVLAVAPRPLGIGAANGEVNRNDEFAIADDTSNNTPSMPKTGCLN
jgi:hypothetical protein